MLDFLVVGSGFAGLSLAYRLREGGFTVQVLEAGSDVGGTWYWNRYPGAYCDIESLEYQLGLPTFLQQEWRWQGKFASQREIEDYLQFVADRLELRPMIHFNQFVEKAQWDESTRTWQIATRQGLAVAARHVAFATGCLSKAQYPRVAGLDTFRGQLLHTGAWPREGVDFTGKRVAVIGTGSSGVQVIPEIARQAQRLYVFQRTANYVLPVRNELLSDDELARRRAAFVQERKAAFRSPAGVAADAPLDRTDPALTPEKLEAELERRWNAGNAFSFLGALPDVFVSLESNRIIAEFFRKKVRQIVKDPVLFEKIVPKDYPIGAKRLCLGMHYYDALQKPNVDVVDISQSGIQQISASSIQTAEAAYEVDAIVFATGFDAITGALAQIEIKANGQTLRDAWAHGAHAYLGVLVSGFPNLFLVTGPNSPSVFGNVVVAIEQHVEWIVRLARTLRDQGKHRLEVARDVEEQWRTQVNAIAKGSIFGMTETRSWYMGDNVPGKPREFLPYLGGFGAFQDICDASAERGYPGIERK
jgi:cyclohexanone monooxygenase